MTDELKEKTPDSDEIIAQSDPSGGESPNYEVGEGNVTDTIAKLVVIFGYPDEDDFLAGAVDGIPKKPIDTQKDQLNVIVAESHARYREAAKEHEDLKPDEAETLIGGTTSIQAWISAASKSTALASRSLEIRNTLDTCQNLYVACKTAVNLIDENPELLPTVWQVLYQYRHGLIAEDISKGLLFRLEVLFDEKYDENENSYLSELLEDEIESDSDKPPEVDAVKLVDFEADGDGHITSITRGGNTYRVDHEVRTKRGMVTYQRIPYLLHFINQTDGNFALTEFRDYMLSINELEISKKSANSICKQFMGQAIKIFDRVGLKLIEEYRNEKQLFRGRPIVAYRKLQLEEPSESETPSEPTEPSDEPDAPKPEAPEPNAPELADSPDKSDSPGPSTPYAPTVEPETLPSIIIIGGFETSIDDIEGTQEARQVSLTVTEGDDSFIWSKPIIVKYGKANNVHNLLAQLSKAGGCVMASDIISDSGNQIRTPDTLNNTINEINKHTNRDDALQLSVTRVDDQVILELRTNDQTLEFKNNESARLSPIIEIHIEKYPQEPVNATIILAALKEIIIDSRIQAEYSTGSNNALLEKLTNNSVDGAALYNVLKHYHDNTMDFPEIDGFSRSSRLHRNIYRKTLIDALFEGKLQQETDADTPVHAAIFDIIVRELNNFRENNPQIARQLMDFALED